MPISVRKLEGIEIPNELREQGLDTAFQVMDSEGQPHIRNTDIEAAALAVEFSEREKQDD